MRDHIALTLRGLIHDGRRFVERSKDHEAQDVVDICLDLLERLARERAWLAQQPVSSLLEADARLVLGRYRILVVRTELLIERYLVTLDGDHVQPWLATWAQLIEMIDQLGSIPAN